MTEQTIAEVAVREASGEQTLLDKLLYTGRMLVKEAYENSLMPDPVDPDEAVQYLAPEIRFWAKPLVRFAAAGFKDRGEPKKLLLNRILAINEAAKDEPEAFCAFDKSGKVL